MSPNSISKLFVGRFENDSPASFGDESNQSNSENNNLKHLNNAQVMETENNVEILEVISNQKTKAYNSQINGDNLGENETNDVNEGEIEVVTDKNKDEIIENKTASNIESTEEENMNIIDDDDDDDDDDYSKERFNIIAGEEIKTNQKNGTKCKICRVKLSNSHPSITRSFYTTTTRHSVFDNIKTSNLTKSKLKKLRFLLKHQLLHSASYKETRRLRFLLKRVQPKRSKHQDKEK